LKLEGIAAEDVTSSCPGSVLITNNGRYGVLAEAVASLPCIASRSQATRRRRARTGWFHREDPQLDDRCASSSGRSARVKSQAHCGLMRKNTGLLQALRLPAGLRYEQLQC